MKESKKIETRRQFGIGLMKLKFIPSDWIFPRGQLICRSCGEKTKQLCFVGENIAMPCCTKCFRQGDIDPKIIELKTNIKKAARKHRKGKIIYIREPNPA